MDKIKGFRGNCKGNAFPLFLWKEEEMQFNKFTELDEMPRLIQAILYNRIASNLNLETVDLNDEQFRDEIEAELDYLNDITKQDPDFKESDLWTIDPEDSTRTFVRLTNLGEFQKLVSGKGWESTGVYAKEGAEYLVF